MHRTSEFLCYAILACLLSGISHRAECRDTFLLSPRNIMLPVIQLDLMPEIDGRPEPGIPGQGIPVPEFNWKEGSAGIRCWFRPGWNDRGLYLAIVVPRADTNKLMLTGRTPDAPFVIDISLDAQTVPDPVGIGKYTLRFIPLVHEVSRMIYRSQPFLMNHRFGSGTGWQDRGAVIWTERTIAGIETDGIRARWACAGGSSAKVIPEYSEGMCMEIFIPWDNLRVKGLPAGHPVYFNLILSEPGGRSNQWIRGFPLIRETGAELVLIRQKDPPANPTHDPGNGPADDPSACLQEKPVYLESTLCLQPAPVRAAVHFTGEYEIEFALLNARGEKLSVQNTVSKADQGFVFATLPTKGLVDGSYRLTVSSLRDGSMIGSRTIILAGNTVSGVCVPYHEMLSGRLYRMIDQENETWVEGHLARAAYLLEMADPERIRNPGGRNPEQLNLSLELCDEVDRVLRNLAKGQRPVTARENHRDIGGFSADGQRGFICFKPVKGPRASVKIETGNRVDWELSPLIYGTFSEPVVFDRPIYGQLYAQLLRNPSFEWGHPTASETLSAFTRRYRQLDAGTVEEIINSGWVEIRTTDEEKVAAPWMGIGKGDIIYRLDSSAYNTHTCQEISIGEGASGAGIAQVLSLPDWRCGSYRFRAFFRSPEGEREVRVQLFHEGEPLGGARFTGIGTSWSECVAEFNVPPGKEPRNTYLLAISSGSPGSFAVDQATLYPADTVGGLDPQVLKQFRDLNTGWTRWPGGNYASIYNWRDGIGPPDKRPSLPNPTWPGLHSNAMGTDEYLRFSRITGQEPLICVNAGTGTPEEAADWVEYCNGPEDSAMGMLRARNGNRSPYKVKYWNIGNELWGNWQWGHCGAGEYAERYLAFARAMKQRDQGVRLLACATGAHTQGYPGWTTTLLDRVGEELDILDFHTYVSVPAAEEGYDEDESIRLMLAIPVAYEQSLMEFRRECVKRGLTHIRVDIGEYNNNDIPGLSEDRQRMTDLLTYAGWLHGFIRQGEYVMGANATEYSVLDPRAGQFGTLHPRYDLFRIYSKMAGSLPVSSRVETPVWQSPHQWGKDVRPVFNVPLVDAIVLKDPDDGSLGIGLINRNLSDEILVDIDLADFDPREKAVQYLFTSGPVRTSEIRARETFIVHLPPHSVSLVKIYPE